MQGTTPAAPPVAADLETYRRELRGYCYRMLASPFEADDAVQETLLRAWRNAERFEGRAAVRTWLYRIATNVCLDMLRSRERRARPMDLGPAREPEVRHLRELPEVTWLEPMPDVMVAPAPDPADRAVAGETLRLAFVAALQRLPARQRAALILCEVLHWKATEAAGLLETSVASVNSALQRARATLDRAADAVPVTLSAPDDALVDRYVDAFQRYDLDALTAIIHEDAVQSMPPYDLWLAGRDDILEWFFGPGAACRGSRVIPAPRANGSLAFGQYKPAASGDGFEPWALQVVEFRGDRVAELTFFLDTERVFPLFGLAPALPA